MKRIIIFSILILLALVTAFCTPSEIPIELIQGETEIENGGSYTFESTGEYIIFTIESVSGEDLTITDISLSGEGMDAFSINDENTDGTIEPLDSYDFGVGFFPTGEGDFTATVTISVEGYSNGYTFDVSGSFQDTPPTENDWTELNPPTNPDGRSNSTMIYAGNGRVILFAGDNADDGFLGDMWMYNVFANTWTEITYEGTETPGERNNPRITYIENDKILLFGGNNIVWTKDELNDTWIFDLNTKEWTDVTPTGTNPPPRHSHELAYIGNDKVILFGGTDASNYFNDVWEFDTSTNEWTELMANDPSPTGQPDVRSSHTMSYIGDNKLLVFGGSQWVSDLIYFDDTWIYDVSSNTWTEITGATPPLDRQGHGMAYDDVNDKVVVFGGFSDTASDEMDDTWEFDVATETWTETDTSTSPQKRSSLRMVYTGNSRIIMFGGDEGFNPSTYYENTWEYGVTTSD
jgi:N-acetylneuraminic acid mutarotase